MKRWQRRSAAWGLTLALGAAGCEDDPVPPPPAPPAANSTARTGVAVRNPRTPQGQGGQADAGGPPPIPVTDQSFVELSLIHI